MQADLRSRQEAAATYAGFLADEESKLAAARNALAQAQASHSRAKARHDRVLKEIDSIQQDLAELGGTPFAAPDQQSKQTGNAALLPEAEAAPQHVPATERLSAQAAASRPAAKTQQAPAPQQGTQSAEATALAGQQLRQVHDTFAAPQAQASPAQQSRSMPQQHPQRHVQPRYGSPTQQRSMSPGGHHDPASPSGGNASASGGGHASAPSRPPANLVQQQQSDRGGASPRAQPQSDHEGHNEDSEIDVHGPLQAGSDSGSIDDTDDEDDNYQPQHNVHVASGARKPTRHSSATAPAEPAADRQRERPASSLGPARESSEQQQKRANDKQDGPPKKKQKAKPLLTEEQRADLKKVADWVRQQLRDKQNNGGLLEHEIELSAEAQAIEGIKKPDKLIVRFEYRNKATKAGSSKMALLYDIGLSFGGIMTYYKNARGTHLPLGLVSNNKYSSPVENVFLLKGVSLETVTDRLNAVGRTQNAE